MIAIDTIACKMASLVPNMAYVVDAPQPGVTQKAGWRDIGFCTAGTEIAPAYSYRPNRDWAGHWASPGFGGSTGSFLTMGAYRSKALSVVKPHEELEPLESDHPLRQLIENPNPQDTSFDLGYEQVMFGELCGVDYLWTPLNRWSKPAECYVLPSHWVWPRTGGGKYANPENPHADELIQWYEVRPWGGMGSAGILRIPPNEIIRTSWKSPINKIDGYSKLWAIAQWIDTEESIAKSRWSQMINQARPEFWVELGPGYDDPNDDRIARMEAKFAAKFQGEYNYGKPIFTPSGAKVTPLSFSPTEMAYFQSEEQVRDTILATWRVPGAAVGLVKEMTYGSILATLLSLCTYALNPRLAMRGLTLTKHLAKHWDEEAPAYSTFDGAGGRGGRRRVRIWWDDCAPADPQQVNSDLMEDRNNYAITPNEVRALRGRKAYRFGGDDPIVQGPGGVMPFPMNTQEDLSWLAEKIAPMTQSQGQASEESVDPSTGKLLGEQLDGENGKPMNNLPVDGEVEEIEGQETPKIENPNGKPQKSLRRWYVRKKRKLPAKIDEELLREVEAIVPQTMPEVVPQQLGVIRGLKIIVVDGDWVKQEYSMDFVEAGNGQRYDYIPKDEIWVDCNIALHDWVPNLYHELTEVPLMAAGEDYEQAHRTANVGENLARAQMHPINRLKGWNVEKTDGPHDYSSTQFNLKDGGYSRSQGSPVRLILSMIDGIDDADLAEDGKETEPHVTVKYGLHTGDPEEVAEVVRGFGPVKIKLGKVSIFPAKEADAQRGGDQYDVVKIDVESPDLVRLNKLICQSLEATDTHPEYKPHVALAYVKPGLGKKYAGSWDGEGMEMGLTTLMFSDKENNKTEIDLTQSALARSKLLTNGVKKNGVAKNGHPVKTEQQVFEEMKKQLEQAAQKESTDGP